MGGGKSAMLKFDVVIAPWLRRQLRAAFFLALIAISLPSPVHADDVPPGWKFITAKVRIVNVQEFPDYLVLALYETGGYNVVAPDETLPCYSHAAPGIDFFAIRKRDFHESEIGGGFFAEQDYFENCPRLIRSHQMAEPPITARSNDPTSRVDQVLRIAALNDDTLVLERIKDVITYENETKQDKVLQGNDCRLGKSRFPYHWKEWRCIRIRNLTDYPEYAFLMRFRDGFRMMTSDQDFDFGRVYAVRESASHPEKIPEDEVAQWNYFIANPKLLQVPVRLSSAAPVMGWREPPKITDDKTSCRITAGCSEHMLSVATVVR
jgi:hypothetical protein